MKTNLIAALSIACLTLTGAALAAGRSAQPEPAAPPAKAKTDAPAAPGPDSPDHIAQVPGTPTASAPSKAHFPAATPANTPRTRTPPHPP